MSKSRRDASQRLLPMVTPRDYADCAVRLKALADHDRLQIVVQLLRGELSVSALAAELRAPIDKVSHHLGILRAARLVESRRQGKFVIYSLAPDSIEAIGAMQNGQAINLGCCQLDLAQPMPPANRRRAASSRRKS